MIVHISRPLAALGVSVAVLGGGLGLGRDVPAGAHAHPAVYGTTHFAFAASQHVAQQVSDVDIQDGENTTSADSDSASVQQGDQSAPDGVAGVAETPDVPAEPSSGADTDNVQLQE
jgi:hypothetical protein